MIDIYFAGAATDASGYRSRSPTGYGPGTTASSSRSNRSGACIDETMMISRRDRSVACSDAFAQSTESAITAPGGSRSAGGEGTAFTSAPVVFTAATSACASA